MAIRNAEPRSDDEALERLRRKRDQEWELAGLARQDRDYQAEARHTANAKDYQYQISEYLK